MNIVICGSRNFDDYKLFQVEMDEFLNMREKETITLVSGGARGADSMARTYAQKYDYKFKEYLADWDGLGKKAGFVRNAQMLEIADTIIAFWDGKSKGTAHMIKEAIRRNIPLVVVDV